MNKESENERNVMMEKIVKAHTDALWGRLEEENVKKMKQIINLISDNLNKNMPSLLKSSIVKEISSIGKMVTLSKSISEGKFEEAFTIALKKSDVSTVSWLCCKVDLRCILTMEPLALSQQVLLRLVQELSSNINKETLEWMTDVAAAIDPTDPKIEAHVELILNQVYQKLCHHRKLAISSPSETGAIRLLMHIIKSLLSTC